MAESRLTAVEAQQGENERLKDIIRHTLWMAGRYADGRRSYAVGLYNDKLALARELGCDGDALDAKDGMFDEPAFTSELERLKQDMARAAAAVRQVEHHCPCGARSESPKTHPHVGGCPVAAALVYLTPQPNDAGGPCR